MKQSNLFTLIPDPGHLPTKKAPKRGQKVKFSVDGLPPFKDRRASIRNPKHRHYLRFMKLRAAATKAMKERCWYDRSIAITITIHANELDEGKLAYEYLSGVLDTLDGSHGAYFTYLPVVFQDDCQVTASHVALVQSNKSFYKISVEFL